jgi:AmiR/NasT family two-component response regulator
VSRRPRIPNLGGRRALVLHRPHQTVTAILRQLAAIGLEVEECWPDLPASALAADFLFFDADLGFDAQFPWKPGEAPMPLVALIGSEAPGRIEWALSHRADAQLLKPVGNAGVYSALLIARQGFDARQTLAREVAMLRERVGERQSVVKAVVALSTGGIGEEQAFAQLRTLAMGWQVTIEEAARRINALKEEAGQDEKSGPGAAGRQGGLA